MTANAFNVGIYVVGPPASPRTLARHDDLLAAYADGSLEDEREAYLSHFVFGPDLETYYAANRWRVAGFTGPCWARWLVLDIDRADLAEALVDARRLVTFLHHRFPEAEGQVPIYFSGSKGFHVLLELAHKPPPALGFQRTARTLAEALANRAGVRIDRSIYDIAHIIRLPNTQHPKTGLFKRRIDAEDFFLLDIDGIRLHAKYAAGDGIPTVRTQPEQLALDWQEAEAATLRQEEARAAVRRDSGTGPDRLAPRYFVEFLRFGVQEGERHKTLFRCAAWLTEQGAPPSLCYALLTEPGRDVGLTPKDVERQITCGIEHARKQTAAESPPGPAELDVCERWEMQHKGGPLPPGARDFPLDFLAPKPGEGA